MLSDKTVLSGQDIFGLSMNSEITFISLLRQNIRVLVQGIYSL